LIKTLVSLDDERALPMKSQYCFLDKIFKMAEEGILSGQNDTLAVILANLK